MAESCFKPTFKNENNKIDYFALEKSKIIFRTTNIFVL